MNKIDRRGFLKTTALLSTLPLIANERDSSTKEVLRFIHVTDSHMDLQDDESVEAIALLVKTVNKNYKDLDFVLFGGDNFNNNVTGNKDALKFKELISQLHCPSYLVRGNKESSPKPADDSINLAEFKSLFMDNKALKVQGKDWLLEKKGYQILGLDSCIEHQNNGLYTKETIAFAKEVLKSGKPTVILNHHPYTNYWGGREEKDIHKYVLGNTKEVQKEIFPAKNLLLTLSGHKHIDSVSEISGTKVIVTRGFVRPLDLEQYPMRYVEISGDKITDKLIYTA
jgi:Icc protein